MGDPRPGFEEVEPRRGGWRYSWWWLLAGLVVGLLLVLVPSDNRDHVLGRTEHVSAQVTEVRMDDGCDSGRRAVYTLAWEDDDGASHESVLRRCGPQRHQVGDAVEVWVSTSGDWASEDGPATWWLWLVGGVAVLAVAVGWLGVWRYRLMARATARRERRRAPGP